MVFSCGISQDLKFCHSTQSVSCEMKTVQLFVAKWRRKLLHMRKGEV